MQEDANFDLAILADQAVRAEVSTPPLSMPDIKHIAIHDRSDVEGRPRRTLDFTNLAFGSTTTNVTEDVGAAVIMDIDAEPPAQAAARSSSSDVPSNERADWLDNGPARVRRALAGYDVPMPGPHFSVRAADADRSDVAPPTRPRMANDATGVNV